VRISFEAKSTLLDLIRQGAALSTYKVLSTVLRRRNDINLAGQRRSQLTAICPRRRAVAPEHEDLRTGGASTAKRCGGGRAALNFVAQLGKACTYLMDGHQS
jgi:hypothetical protein